MIVVNTPFHAARSRRDTVGMCTALLATLKPPRDPGDMDSGPVVRVRPTVRLDSARRDAA
jgi:hypothetical protein